jgi:type IV fimbrial biogenesis protein FimT|tara:strand:+ start:4093 stop:4593 length:501 start_codon:yes stop_codon:yes gene_type:complete
MVNRTLGNRGAPSNGSGGFTLIELMLVVVVLSIILAIATPSFLTFVKQVRVDTAANDFTRAVALARSEATKRRQSVSLTLNSDGWSVDILVDEAWVSVLTHVVDTSVQISASIVTIGFLPKGRLNSDTAVCFADSSVTSGAVETKRVAINLAGSTTITTPSTLECS